MTDPSKMPHDAGMGMVPISSGVLIFREHVVRPVSSSYVALGNFAGRTMRVWMRPASTRLTVPKSGNHCDKRSIEHGPVIVDARGVYVKDPDSLARLNHERGKWDGGGTGISSAQADEATLTDRLDESLV
jgi:hypothetical protein